MWIKSALITTDIQTVQVCPIFVRRDPSSMRSVPKPSAGSWPKKTAPDEILDYPDAAGSV